MSLQFKLVVSTAPVVLTDSNGGASDYELREMTAAGRDKYLDGMKERVQVGADGKPSIKKFAGMQADLVSRCLFNKDGTAVPVKTIQGWPSSVVSALFAESQKLNQLSTAAKEIADESKNG